MLHRGGEPAAGVKVAFQPTPLFPGSDVVVDRNRPGTTDVDGATLATLLHPGGYLVSIPGRRDVVAVAVSVNEGSETQVVIEVP